MADAERSPLVVGADAAVRAANAERQKAAVRVAVRPAERFDEQQHVGPLAARHAAAGTVDAAQAPAKRGAREQEPATGSTIDGCARKPGSQRARSKPFSEKNWDERASVWKRAAGS